MLKHTRQIRKIMKEHGRVQIFTNKYVLTRTVKCYVPKDDAIREKLVKALGAYMNDNNLIGIMNIKLLPGAPNMWSASALIVSFPID